MRMSAGAIAANPSAVLMEVDRTVGANEYRSNLYVSGRLDGRTPAAGEIARPDFSSGWYAAFPAGIDHRPDAFTPTPGAPLAKAGTFSPYAPLDRLGNPRSARVDLGPVEAR
jgi:hypothetical protein